MKKTFIFISLFCMVLIFSGCENKKDVFVVKEKLELVACPTFQSFFENNENIKLIKSNSTVQSLILLKNGIVNYALGGRTLKPNENFDYISLGTGYSFLHKNSLIISDNELQNQKFYTDLDDLENIKKTFGIQNLEKVENVYDYVDENIIITSWENTDYKKANIVHVLHTGGGRYIESRIPVLYCREKCDEEIIDITKTFLSKILYQGKKL